MSDSNTSSFTPTKTTSPLFKWLFIATLVILGVVLYRNYDARKSDELRYQARSQELDKRIQALERDKASLTGDLNQKNNMLSGYLPYLPLIQNLKLADTAYKALPFRYGQRVRILPDSSDGIINSLSLTANELEYAVRYLVRNKKGELVSLSVSDIMAVENKK